MEQSFTVEDREVSVKNLDKVFYPKTAFTKGQVIEYYIKIAPVLLPHLKDRPISLKRYPNGVNGEFFYEKQCPSYRPDWVDTAPVWSKVRNATIDYCVFNDLPSLIWAANLAVLELHLSLSKRTNLEQPTSMVFDLDPGEGVDIHACCAVAQRIQKLLKAKELESFPKTSGSKGLQLYVPLNTKTDYENTKTCAKELAVQLEQETPDLVVSKMAKVLRKGKVFIDWSQNDEHKTTVSVYSLRATETPRVSTPLKWEEVSAAVKAPKKYTLQFGPDEVLRRVEKWGDLFEPLLALKQKLKR